jgi:hypothetical protein
MALKIRDEEEKASAPQSEGKSPPKVDPTNIPIQIKLFGVMECFW